MLSMAPKFHPVYKVRSKIAFPDPHMPPGRLHHDIFVETDPEGTGHLYTVVGDITSRGGMVYASKKAANPLGSESFHSRELLGYTPSDTHPDEWDSVLGSLPTPPQQKAPNPARHGRVEPFKQKISDYEYVFYESGEEHRPLWKCTEWIEQYAIPTLRSKGTYNFFDFQ
ncbi:hypothetical protein GGS23DRAFT_619607 [Durotheca rogersii]|uniref:uncharacterized protein n=1 Tax=Durotheca rogersii TaxID=419775 RepID=UPI00221F7544|nr:uncharacterized protein GGS23DRAFT_619607 [Durotheca rogersii]KAI5864898.1 hypothetical protein GGS23DRAFT_619607 [Durotheca rogersii]